MEAQKAAAERVRRSSSASLSKQKSGLTGTQDLERSGRSCKHMGLSFGVGTLVVVCLKGNFKRKPEIHCSGSNLKKAKHML